MSSKENSAPPSGSNSNSPSPSSSSSSSPPPSSSDSSSSSSSSPPPPPPQDDSSSAPPPPSKSGSSSPSPSPPSNDDSSSAPLPSNDNSPPPPSDNDSFSPSPPPSGSNGNSPPPPPSPSPPKSNNNNGRNSNEDGGDDSNSPPLPPGYLDGNSPPAHRTPHPPPPPQSHRSPPSLKDSSLDDEGKSLSHQTGVTAGAAVEGGLLLILMFVLVVVCVTKKKRKTRELKHNRDDSHGPRKSYFTNNGQNWNNGRSGPDHIVQIPTPSGTMSAGVSSEYGWPIQPPPPPPMMSSSEMSSAGFSSGPPLPPPHPAMALGFSQSSFTYENLATATNGFTQSNLLGQGGFGYVYKGVLPNGKEIAVKCLKLNSGQGNREFQAEVDIISRVHHRHLVELVGYCTVGSQRMLVYEFVPNGTLEHHLHGAGRPTMDWPTRLKIAIGSAKGFAYLHEDCHPRIIHRDIKAANILLDLNFESKVADFGLAKLSQDNYTHVSTRIMGTFGYLAPEYASSGKLTEKSDIYSFGVMLLELITGRRPIYVNSDGDSLVDWARPILVSATEGGSYEKLVDPQMENNYDHLEMRRLVFTVVACIRHSARRRPKMSQIVRALEGDVSLDDLNVGGKGPSPVSSSTSSFEDLKRVRKSSGATTTSSQEFTSSEVEHSTGEFVHPNNAK